MRRPDVAERPAALRAPRRGAAPPACARRHRRVRPRPARRPGRRRHGGRRGRGGTPGQPAARRGGRSAGCVRAAAAHVAAAGPALDPGLGPRVDPRSRRVRRRAFGVAGFAPAPALQFRAAGRHGPRRGLAPVPRSHDASRGALARGGVAAGQPIRRRTGGPVPAGGGRPDGDGHRRRPDHGGAERRRSSARARCRRGRCPSPEGGRRRRVPPHGGHARASQERGPVGAGLRPGARLAPRPVAARDRRAGRDGARSRRSPGPPTTWSSRALSPTSSSPRCTGEPAPSPMCHSRRATACRPWRPCSSASRPWCPTRSRACATSVRWGRRPPASSTHSTSTTSPGGWPTS